MNTAYNTNATLELNRRYVLKTDADLAADLRYCLDIVKDRRAPDSVRDSAKDEAIELQAEINARKAVRS